MTNNYPLVSVFCPTYNHENFIRKALNGFVKQKVNFPIEIIVQDDASTDTTPDIIKEFAHKYDFIKPVLHETNYYSNGKNINEYFFKNAKGKYIAICEGDDYWTDPNKLQKQVDFLEANPDYSLCFHNCILKNERQYPFTESLLINGLTKSTFETEDILQQWFIPTASIVFKQEGLVLPEWFSQVEVSGDIVLLLLMSLLGKFKYIDEVMSVYLLHPAGISVPYFGYKKAISMIFLYENFNRHTKYKYSEKILEAIKYELHAHVIDKLLFEKEAEVLNSLLQKNILHRIIYFTGRKFRNLKHKIKLKTGLIK